MMPASTVGSNEMRTNTNRSDRRRAKQSEVVNAIAWWIVVTVLWFFIACITNLVHNRLVVLLIITVICRLSRLWHCCELWEAWDFMLGQFLLMCVILFTSVPRIQSLLNSLNQLTWPPLSRLSSIPHFNCCFCDGLLGNSVVIQPIQMLVPLVSYLALHTSTGMYLYMHLATTKLCHLHKDCVFDHHTVG